VVVVDVVEQTPPPHKTPHTTPPLKGRCAYGLERSDFTCWKTKEQEIPNIQFSKTQLAQAALFLRRLSTLPENDIQHSQIQLQQGQSNVILLDALNTTLPHQAYVRYSNDQVSGEAAGRPTGGGVTLGSK